MVSSLFAVGYHEQTETNGLIPAFLKDPRQAAFARAYSADKNVSIFLVRPARLHQKYCSFVLPGHPREMTQPSGSDTLQRRFQWPSDEKFDYVAETQWSALCVILKEDILDLFKERSYDDRIRRARLAVSSLV